MNFKLIYQDNVFYADSRQVAELVDKRHSDLCRDIAKYADIVSTNAELRSLDFFVESTYKDKKGETRKRYDLTKQGCEMVANKLAGKKGIEFTAKYVTVFNAMKKQIEQSKPSVPQNYLEVLKSLVKAEEEKQQLALENKQKDETIITISKANVELGNKITEMLPKVSYYDRILQSNATMTITQIAQDYGMSAIAMNKELESMRIQHKERGQWILYAQFLKGGYVHSRAVDIIRKDGRHDVKYNTEWTTKGRIFLYEALKGKGILPLIEQENTPRYKGTGGRQSSKTTGASQQTINFE